MKSYGSGGTLWVLLEVPPHGSCPPWPETIGRVAEWCGRNAGRRSAGLGSKGVTRAHTHAVGVRAFCACLRNQRAICEGGGHRAFDGAKVRKK